MSIVEITDFRNSIVKDVRRWGDMNTDALLDPQCQFFSTPSIAGFIGYMNVLRTAVVFGDPVCAEDDQSRLTQAFHEHCKKQNLNVVYAIVSEKFASMVAAQNRWALIHFGNKLIIDPSQQHAKTTGSRAVLLRKKMKQAQKGGAIVQEYTIHDPALEKKMEALGEVWLQGRKGPQVHIAKIDLFNDRTGKRWFYAMQGNQVVGMLVLNQLQIHSGWLLNNLFCSPDAPKGTSELLIISTLEILEKEDCHHVAIGPVTIEKMDKIMGLNPFFAFFIRAAFKYTKKIFRLDNQGVFWEKFSPKTEPAYLLFERLNIRTIRALLQSMNVKI